MIMKRKLIFFTVLLALAGLFTLQSCQEEATPIVSHFIFTEPAIEGPANANFLHITGTTADLKWTSTNESGDPIKADVYFGTSEDPGLYKANHNALTLTVPVVKNEYYYWYVVMKDANGFETIGPTWSFNVFEAFAGNYNADEPAEDYSYDVTFVKSSATVTTTDNYWNSGWTAVFTLDLTAKTYSMPKTTWGGYSGQESGTIDPATGTMVGDYTIWQGAAVIETGVHTYTKKF
jgi:hypothetical protein